MEEHGPKVVIIVAHPDDEIMWAGGTMLLNPEWEKTIVTLCRARDADRAPKFFRILEHLGAVGGMADMEDGPEQHALPEGELRRTVVGLIGNTQYDLLLTHGPEGEYTRHRRHEEVSQAVTALWREGEIRIKQVWVFAYTDAHGTTLPQASADAHFQLTLPPSIWREKFRLIHDVYGFDSESWEARVMPRTEAFWCFPSPAVFVAWRARKDAAP